MAKRPVQFDPDNVRKELDQKIEQKVSNHVFYCAIGFISASFIGIMAYMMKINDSVNANALKIAYIESKSEAIPLIANKFNSINDRVVRIETKINK